MKGNPVHNYTISYELSEIHVWLELSRLYATYLLHMRLVGFNLIKIMKWVLDKSQAAQNAKDLIEKSTYLSLSLYDDDT